MVGKQNNRGKANRTVGVIEVGMGKGMESPRTIWNAEIADIL